MIYNRQRLPLVSLEKIKISKSSKYSIEIDYCLKEISTQSIASYKRAAGERKGVNLILIIMTTETESFLPGLQNIRTRPMTVEKMKRDHSSYIREVALSEIITASNITSIPSSRGGIENILKSTATQKIETPEMSETSHKRINNIHLLSFLQITDSTGPIPRYYLTKDSEVEYELLMHRVSGELVPVSKRRVFYTDSLVDPTRSVPYNGAAHYHSETNPGPGGYVGWMAGHANSTMGPKLKIREVDNYKVIFENVLDADKKQKKDAEIPAEYPSAATGTGLLKSIKNPVIGVSSSSSRRHLVAASKSALEKDKKSFFYGLGNQTAHVITTRSHTGRNTYSSDKYNNYHASAFGIDFLSMLRYRSPHGPLIDFHFRKGETNILSEALRRSKIVKMEIKRIRISNHANKKNQKGTREYTEYSKDEKEKRIVFSSDAEITKRYKGRFRRFRSLDGEVHEVSLAAINEAGQVFDHPDCKYIRQFLFKDFDLFHNNTEGKYTYSVSVEINDGMQSLLMDRYEKLQKAISFFEKYSLSVLMQAKEKVYHEKRTSNEKNQENYAINKNNRSFVSAIVNLYYEVLSLLEGKPTDNNKKQSTTNAISSTNLDLDSINKFLSSLKKMRNSFERRIKTDKPDHIGKTSSTNLSGVVPGNISEVFKTNITMPAFNESKIVANYIPGLPKSSTISASNLDSVLQPLRSTVYTNSYKPSELLTIKGQRYKTDDAHGFKSKKEKKFTPLDINVLASSTAGSLASIASTNLKFKLAVLESPGADKESLNNKGDLFFSRKVQELGAGLKLKINGRDIASIDESEVKDKDKSGLSVPDMSSAIQKAIFDSNREIEEKDQTLKDLEKEYKKMVNIREKLGPIYDGLTATVKIGEKILSTSTSERIYQNKYKNTGTKLNASGRSQGSVPLMDEYATRLKVILPGIYEQYIDINAVNIQGRTLESSIPRLIIMKLEPIFPKNVIQSNNLFFVEV